ncbi:MAG: glycosyltransferase family 2 protein [Microgenomates group bacterium]|nr:glycosyltransferase family 2 protein [Microgenomates group bacterium]
MKISAVILTKNEEKNISRCLQSLDFVDEIIILDDFSTDKTLDIVKNKLKSRNYKIIKKALLNDFSQQKNYSLNRATNDWVLFIDADEEIDEELKKNIIRIGDQQSFSAYYIKRRDFFWERELRFGETRKARDLGFIRLFKKDSGFWVGKVHETVAIKDRNKTGRLNGFLNHYPHPSMEDFLKKINFYSTLRAKELFFLKKKTHLLEIIFFPFGKFLLNYFFYFGFLDGIPGFVYAFLMSFHSFLVRAKLYQYTYQKKIL